MTTKRTITIWDSQRHKQLARGLEEEQVQLFEGAWYFDETAVDMTHLTVTDRTYVCPYKGTCYWIDLDAPTHKAQNVAFVYFDVNSDYEFIKDKIGFYAGKREATYQEARNERI